jgi:exosortase D (VPLPA-CTERM-specific)
MNSAITESAASDSSRWVNYPGIALMVVAVAGATVVFADGIAALLSAWQLPEYSHGPLIPLLSLLLLLRHLAKRPPQVGPVTDRWPGVALAGFALFLGLAGTAIAINDIVAYGLILWIVALFLISFGWQTGRRFWPEMLHLVYMLPLPGALYYGLSTYLQGISSELGVYFLQVLRVPVFLSGNIIDLYDYKLQVAEACSGLRYLFPILSFSYVFAVLYQGPVWHKAVLLIAAAPITVLMNSVRIAVAGYIVRHMGVSHVEGFTHFFEGWVIFIISVALLWIIAWVMMRLHGAHCSVLGALDLETEGLGTQLMRVRLIQPSRALVGVTAMVLLAAASLQAVPERDGPVFVDRDPFALFPSQLGAWQAGPHRPLDRDVERILAADDFHSVALSRPGDAVPVDLMLVWYADQMSGGVHSPEVCLPGGGWEIADLRAVELTGPGGGAFQANRAIIQQGVERMVAYYWFEQQGRRTASEFEAKFQLMLGKLTNGRDDSALVRLITPVRPGEGEGAADARLRDAVAAILEPLDRFIPAP